METINVEQKRKVDFVSGGNNDMVRKKKHTDLEEFLKGTIYGEKLVKNVCDKSDEKCETGDNNILSGKQAASECNAIPLESFISELHRKVDIHFAVCK